MAPSVDFHIRLLRKVASGMSWRQAALLFEVRAVWRRPDSLSARPLHIIRSDPHRLRSGCRARRPVWRRGLSVNSPWRRRPGPKIFVGYGISLLVEVRAGVVGLDKTRLTLQKPIQHRRVENANSENKLRHCRCPQLPPRCGITSRPKRSMVFMISLCDGPPEWAWRRRSRK